MGLFNKKEEEIESSDLTPEMRYIKDTNIVKKLIRCLEKLEDGQIVQGTATLRGILEDSGCIDKLDEEDREEEVVTTGYEDCT